VVIFSITIGNENTFRSMNLPPFKSMLLKIVQVGSTYYERDPFLLGPLSESAIGKMVLLLPLGFLAPIIWGKISRLKNILLIGLIVSVGTQVFTFISLEYEKLKFSTNIREVLFSVLGVFIGRIIYKIISKKIGKFVYHR
jgi:glycopeptide antibiotics resistance protein